MRHTTSQSTVEIELLKSYGRIAGSMTYELFSEVALSGGLESEASQVASSCKYLSTHKVKVRHAHSALLRFRLAIAIL